MIVLDTNVTSEILKSEPAKGVIDWMDSQDPNSIYITTITIAESMYGVGAMPDGKKKRSLQAAYEDLFAYFQNRILSFDHIAARSYSEVAVAARKAGRGFPTPDGYIAAIAHSRGMAIATRDTGPYLAVPSLTVINPFEQSE